MKNLCNECDLHIAHVLHVAFYIRFEGLIDTNLT